MPQGPGGVIFLLRRIMQEPAVKRAIAFFDGQNLYHHAKSAFGYHHPNYDPVKLFNVVCKECGLEPAAIRFYTGLPAADREPMWHGYWANRLLSLRRSGVLILSRPLRYHSVEIHDSDGSARTITTPTEKGIDVRIALDIVRLTLSRELDVGVLFSQDQDLAEVATEVREIARRQKRWIRLISAYPVGSNASAKRGIDKTDWFRIDRTMYDSCLDPHDYRPRSV
jgi:uncharacterized LabA/DUF88 family protein